MDGRFYVTVTASGGQIVAHGAQGIFFQPGDLGLGDTYGFGYLHLGLPLKKAQFSSLFFLSLIWSIT